VTQILEIVKCPKENNQNEWIGLKLFLNQNLAMNVVDFINDINVIYSGIIESCTEETCPAMVAKLDHTEEFKYMWMNKNDDNFLKPVSVSAPKYFELLMEWIESQLNDETVFTPDPNDYSKKFEKVVKDIFKRLFRIYAHIYSFHFVEISSKGEESQLNGHFTHFMAFIFEFDLMKENEYEVLKAQIVSILGDKFKTKFK
jgi:MOB kinase activator 1